MGRTYPRAYDLGKVKNWLKALETYPVPLNEISRRKLKQKLKQGKIHKDIYEQVIKWKREVGISWADELEYKYLLENIGVIESRKLNVSIDLMVPLGGVGPSLEKLLNKETKTRMYGLSEDGYALLDFLKKGQISAYEQYLFWLILRCDSFDPLLQRTICNPKSYMGNISEVIPSTDKVSIHCTLSWGRFFGIFVSENIERNRLSTLLISSCCLELNRFILKDSSSQRFFIDELASYLSKKFRLDPSAVNFPQILEVIFKKDSNIKGFTSGRGRLSLPSYPDIHILEFNRKISLDILEDIAPSDLAKVLFYG